MRKPIAVATQYSIPRRVSVAPKRAVEIDAAHPGLLSLAIAAAVDVVNLKDIHVRFHTRASGSLAGAPAAQGSNHLELQ